MKKFITLSLLVSITCFVTNFLESASTKPVRNVPTGQKRTPQQQPSPAKKTTEQKPTEQNSRPAQQKAQPQKPASAASQAANQQASPSTGSATATPQQAKPVTGPATVAPQKSTSKPSSGASSSRRGRPAKISGDVISLPASATTQKSTVGRTLGRRGNRLSKQPSASTGTVTRVPKQSNTKPVAR